MQVSGCAHSGLMKSLKFMDAKNLNTQVCLLSVFAFSDEATLNQLLCLTVNTSRFTKCAKLVSKLVCSQTSEASLITS